MLGYFFGGRVGEYTCTPSTIKLGDIRLEFRHFSWIKQKSRIKSLLWKIEKSKVNPFGDKLELVEAKCECSGPGAPCTIDRLIKERKRFFGKKHKPTDPVLAMENGKPLSASELNNFISAWAVRLGLKAEEYSSHSLRIGRASDLACDNNRILLLQNGVVGPLIVGKAFMLNLIFLT